MPPHTPSCEVPEAVFSGSAVEFHCKDKLSVPPATYNWYKDNKPLAPGHTPDSHYSLDTHSGTLVRDTHLNGTVAECVMITSPVSAMPDD